MCRIGEFNLLHTSLTSAAALTTLQELPNTNLTLYHEITGRKTQESTGAEDDFPEEDDKPTEYSSYIPVEVIMAQIVSGGSVTMEGFKVDDDGSIVWTGVAEEMDVVHDEPTTGGCNSIVAVSLGHGHWVKVVSTRHDGAAWEES
jgi:hypothetical protein